MSQLKYIGTIIVNEKIEKIISSISAAYNCPTDWRINRNGGIVILPLDKMEGTMVDLVKLESVLCQISKDVHIMLVPLGIMPHWAAHVSVKLKNNEFAINLLLK